MVFRRAKLAPRHAAAHGDDPAVEVDVAPLERAQLPGPWSGMEGLSWCINAPLYGAAILLDDGRYSLTKLVQFRYWLP